VIHNFQDITTQIELDRRVKTEIIDPFNALEDLEKPFDISLYLQQTQFGRKIIHMAMVNTESQIIQQNENIYNFINSQLLNNSKFRDMQELGPLTELMEHIRNEYGNYILMGKELTDRNFKLNLDLEQNRIDIAMDQANPQDWKINPSHPNLMSSLPRSVRTGDFYTPDVTVVKEEGDGVRIYFEISFLKYASVKFEVMASEVEGSYEVVLSAERFTEKMMQEKKVEFITKGAMQKKVYYKGSFSVDQELDVDDKEKIASGYEHGMLHVLVPFKGVIV